MMFPWTSMISRFSNSLNLILDDEFRGRKQVLSESFIYKKAEPVNFKIEKKQVRKIKKNALTINFPQQFNCKIKEENKKFTIFFLSK